MQFRGGMTEMMRQAARVQRKIEQIKSEAKDKELTHTAMDGKISIVITWVGKISRITVDPEFVAKEGLDLALDGICAAVNGAHELATKTMDAELEKVMGAKIPGL